MHRTCGTRGAPGLVRADAWLEPPTSMSILRYGCVALGLACTSGTDSPKDSDADTGQSPSDDTDGSDDTASTDDTGWSCEEGSPHVEVGTGDSGYEPLSSGAPVTMVHGPQGGWHVLGSARLWNMEPIVDIHFVVTDIERDAVVADNVYRVATVVETECTGLFWGMYGYLDVREIEEGELDTPPELLAYQDLRMTLIVSDRTGAVVESSVVVKAVPDPQDLNDTGVSED